jgi:adenylate kinase family enzyme
MSPLTFIFIGRSGCGKGTQADILQKYLREKDPQGEILYVETGANFRKFIAGEKYSNKLSADIYKTGARQPDFLAIWMWSHIVLDEIKGNEHIIFDGITRSLPEAQSFTTALTFYNRRAHVIYIDVSREWSEQKLVSRGRADDKSMEEIKKRLDWFERDTLPAVEYFKSHRAYDFHEINGEKTIEEVKDQIFTKIGI